MSLYKFWIVLCVLFLVFSLVEHILHDVPVAIYYVCWAIFCRVSASACEPKE